MQITTLILSSISFLILLSLIGWQLKHKAYTVYSLKQLHEMRFEALRIEIEELSNIIDAFNIHSGTKELDYFKRLPERSTKYKLEHWYNQDEIRVLKAAKGARGEMTKDLYIEFFETFQNYDISLN